MAQAIKENAEYVRLPLPKEYPNIVFYLEDEWRSEAKLIAHRKHDGMISALVNKRDRATYKDKMCWGEWRSVHNGHSTYWIPCHPNWREMTIDDNLRPEHIISIKRAKEIIWMTMYHGYDRYKAIIDALHKWHKIEMPKRYLSKDELLKVMSLRSVSSLADSLIYTLAHTPGAEARKIKIIWHLKQAVRIGQA